jgi:hypothetical protein
MHHSVSPSPLEGEQIERLRPVNWLKKCLPNEPRILHPVAQASLTAHYLLPVLPALESCLLAVRHRLDNELARRQPVKLGKAYPLGQCLEIAQAVQQCLRTVAEADLPAESVVGLQALRTFLRAGGDFRQVWGDLRGEYFQNAYQVGTLYIDVANDTVNPAKPKVEILPFCEAQFVPIRDFQHFRKIAHSYWQNEVYPNHILPELAPHCPLIHVSKNGIVKLHDATQYMLAMTRTQAFAPSERMLREPPMPQVLFEQLRHALQGAGHAVATSLEQGRKHGLHHCREQRDKRWHLESKRVTSVIRDTHQINLHLARWQYHLFTQHPSAQSKIMSTIQIDNNTYELDSLSDDAKAQLQSIRFVDQELARLEAQVAAMQTARNAYLNALKAVLPVV